MKLKDYKMTKNKIVKYIAIIAIISGLEYAMIKSAYNTGYRNAIVECTTYELEDLLKNVGLTIEKAEKYFYEIDKLIDDGIEEDKAVEIVFNKHKNNPFGDVSTLMDYYDIYNGEYND